MFISPGRAPAKVVRQISRFQLQSQRQTKRRIQAPESAETLEVWRPYLEKKLAGVLKLRIRSSHRPPGRQPRYMAANALSSVYVSIIDLLECWEIEEKPRIFRNRKELSKYIKAGKMFHCDIAKQDKVLHVLLRRLA
ncbi:unnamed protein product [Penicillium pancosmium]